MDEDIAVRKEGGSLRLSASNRRRLSWVGMLLSSLVFTLALTLAVLATWRGAWLTGPGALIVFLLVLSGWRFALNLRRAVNRTVVTLDQSGLSLKEEPLPVPFHSQHFARADLGSFSVDSRRASGVAFDDAATEHDVVLELSGGKRVILFERLDKREAATLAVTKLQNYFS